MDMLWTYPRRERENSETIPFRWLLFSFFFFFLNTNTAHCLVMEVFAFPQTWIHWCLGTSHSLCFSVEGLLSLDRGQQPSDLGPECTRGHKGICQHPCINMGGFLASAGRQHLPEQTAEWTRVPRESQQWVTLPLTSLINNTDGKDCKRSPLADSSVN